MIRTAALLLAAATGVAQSPLTTTFSYTVSTAVGGAVMFELECLDPAGLSIADWDLNVLPGWTGNTATCEVYLQPLGEPGTTDPHGEWVGPVSTGFAAVLSPVNTPTNFVLTPPLTLGAGCRYAVAIKAVDFAHPFATAHPPAQIEFATNELELLGNYAVHTFPQFGTLFVNRLVNISIPYTAGGQCPPIAASVPVGAPCVVEYESFVERLSAATMDLSGRRLTAVNRATFPDTAYTVTTAPGSLHAIGSLAPASVIPFTGVSNQTLPVGSLGLHVAQSCVVFDGPGVPNAGLTWQQFHTWSSRIALDPTLAGSGQVYYEELGTRAQITFDGVRHAAASGPNYVQFVIDTATGDFEMAWGAMAGPFPYGDLTVGYSPPGQSLLPEPVDLSLATVADPVETYVVDRLPLDLRADFRPVQGGVTQSFCVTTAEIDPAAWIHLGVVGLVSPGLPLEPLGTHRSCHLWARPDVLLATALPSPGAPATVQWCPLVLPAAPPSFVGFEFYLQAVTLDPGAAVVDMTTRVSNGLRCTVGDQ